MKPSPQHRRRMPRLVAALTGTLLLSGCLYNGWPFRKNPLERPQTAQTDTGDRGFAGGVAQEGVGWKVVSGKRAPHFLLARDGTECMVPAARWESALIGQKVFCIWG